MVALLVAPRLLGGGTHRASALTVERGWRACGGTCLQGALLALRERAERAMSAAQLAMRRVFGEARLRPSSRAWGVLGPKRFLPEMYFPSWVRWGAHLPLSPRKQSARPRPCALARLP